MEDLNTRNLNLLAPLRYTRQDAPPDGLFPGEGLPPEEWVFCFDLDRNQAQAFEPEGENYLGNLVFQGKTGNLVQMVEIPAGKYLFAQKRSLLGRQDIISMAIEVQKDGLWERWTLNNRLYIRFLYEDEAPVSQIFRPVEGDMIL